MLSNEQIIRERDLLDLQDAYPNNEFGLLLFAQRAINTLIPGNFDLIRQQADILKWLYSGPKYRGVEANRGIGKTALAGIYCAFRLIHTPHARVAVFSQNSKRAKEISGWVIKIIMGLPELECLRPDKNAGDRSSLTEGFDIYGGLKGSDKSPSVVSYSIEGGAQGARADIILADDVESLQNSRTVMGRETLEEATKEFESINQRGDIIYLGTPQSVDSIYNNLPSRGYSVRIWTARYPTEEELATYNGMLAPSLVAALRADPSLQSGGGFLGNQGQPTCPEMFPEEILQEKELSQGPAKFKLQYMLNTALTDAERFPLKLKNLIVTDFGIAVGPQGPIWGSSAQNLHHDLPQFGNRRDDRFYAPLPVMGGYEMRPFSKCIMYIDPAGGGQNGDATSYVIVKLLDGYVYLADIGSVKGGFDPEDMMSIVLAAKQHNVNEVFMERNFGNGAHWHLLKPIFDEVHPCIFPEENLVWESGQKELRIIDVLEPVISNHRLVVSTDVVRKDSEIIQQYPAEKRLQYSLFSQMSLITRDKDCLAHDDILDALAGAVRELTRDIAFNAQAFISARKKKEALVLVKAWADPKSRRTWLGEAYGACTQPFGGTGTKKTSGGHFARRGKRAGRRRF